MNNSIGENKMEKQKGDRVKFTEHTGTTYNGTVIKVLPDNENREYGINYKVRVDRTEDWETDDDLVFFVHESIIE